MAGKIYLVGFGPGSAEHLTFRAREAIREADTVVGYSTYVELIEDLVEGKEVFQTGMREEIDRGRRAVDQAETGRRVAVVSSGDAGIYGMAGLVYEVLHERGWSGAEGEIEVEVIPGVSALNAVASLVGAPLMNDFVSISLSDHLTPWDLIVKRLHAAGDSDLVVVLYNPASGERTRQVVEARQVLSGYREPTTPVAIVKSAYREAQDIVLTDLEHMLNFPIGMLTTIIVGNSQTYVQGGRMVTPRGYQRKYRLVG